MRVNHYLKHNIGTEVPRHFLFFDVESWINGNEHSFRLACAIHTMKTKNGWTKQEIIPLYSISDLHNLLDNLRIDTNMKLYVIAHNMAYDYAIGKIDTYLSSRKIEIEGRVISSAFIIKCKGLVFLDSMNFYKTSLEKLGEMIGLHKMEKPDFLNVSNEKLIKYCIRDTEVLSKVMIRYIDFIEKNDLGCFQPTIASQAFTAFRHRFMHDKILIHTHNDILDMEKTSYRGGRTEVFRFGKFKNIHKLDINSMYPFVMKTNAFPTRLISYHIEENISIENVFEAIHSGAYVLLKCELEMYEPFIPCSEEKLIFPIGKFVQVIQNPEIDYLSNHPETGKITKIHRLVVYESRKIFTDYIDFFWKVKHSAKTDAEKTMAKIFMNSLYGKFGQRNYGNSELVLDVLVEKEILEIMGYGKTNEVLCANDGGKYTKIGDYLYYHPPKTNEYAFNSVPIIASAVTAYSRRKLFELIKKAGFQNVFYCDTDSLFVTKEGYQNLQSEVGDGLGLLRLEEINDCEIRGVKDYTFGNEVKIKGVKKDAEKLTEFSFKQKHFETKNMRYRHGVPDGIVMVRDIIKTFSREYDKGIVHPNGIVTPFILNDI